MQVKSPPGAARQPALTDALLHSATTGDGQEQSESAADADERLLDNALKASNGSEPPANTCKVSAEPGFMSQLQQAVECMHCCSQRTQSWAAIRMDVNN